jgi:hypothetical protein
MARLARVVAPGVPHHVTQRGNRRQRTFFTDEDEVDILRRHQRTGRPLGDDAFVERLEASLGRNLRPRKPGPKPRKTPREPRDR